ncbi:MAG: low specificity L-threonine aldolase [Acidobacteriota bacterium]|nr:MAG: low specificity L-threonine aldolase [Acidobacteriota bacterium]
MIDLRSDTVTRPTPAMRKAMADAEVGDDVYSEDPTVNSLQERAAEIFGREAALFVPTGSMGNQVAVKLHTKPGDEIVIEERGHIFNYEMGTPAVVSGVIVRPVKSSDGSGMLTWTDIEPALHVDQPYYSCPTGLICLENSHNLAGGSVMTAAECRMICENAHSRGIPVHMDGARIFNASAALGTSVRDLTGECDSVQFCLSKGLGAPVGSVLVGSREFIAEARVWRKRLGGGMRQVGVLAAAGLVALEESPPKLADDHANAKTLAEGLAELPGLSIDPEKVVTNIVIVDASAADLSSQEIVEALKEKGVLAIGFGSAIRMVTHFDVSSDDIAKSIAAFREILAK